MPTIYKVLGQVSPVSATPTSLYTVGVGVQAVCSTLVVCNIGTSTSFRVAVRPNGEVLNNKHYIVYDNYINQGDSVFLTLGMTISSSDIVEVYTGSSNVSFSLFGSEITA